MRPSHHRDGRGDGAGGADLGLDGARGLEVRRVRHAVGDDGRFERDERPAGGDRLGDLGREGERWGHATSQAMWRAEAASAARAPPPRSRPSARAARCAATKASPAPVRLPVATGGGAQADACRRGAAAVAAGRAVGDDRLGAPRGRAAPAAAARLSAKARAAERLGLAAVAGRASRGRRRAAAPRRAALPGSPGRARARRPRQAEAAPSSTGAGRLPSTTTAGRRPGRQRAAAAQEGGARRLQAGAVGDRGVELAVRRLDREVAVGRAVVAVELRRSRPAAPAARRQRRRRRRRGRPPRAARPGGRSAASASATLSATPPGRRLDRPGTSAPGGSGARGAADDVPVRGADAEERRRAGIRLGREEELDVGALQQDLRATAPAARAAPWP